MDIFQILKNVKSSKEIFLTMKKYTSNKKDKYSTYLMKNLSNQKDYKKSLQTAYNYLLNQEMPIKTKDTAYVPYKGTAIGGMECHSAGHR